MSERTTLVAGASIGADAAAGPTASGVAAVFEAARAAVLASALLIGAVASAADARQTVEPAVTDATATDPRTTSRERTTPPAPPDLSGRARTGKASFYAKKFTGRKMADGHRMDPHADNAASKTLPLGTTARVTNLETGLSAEVTIEDRGPYVKGRIVDLSPTTAREIGIDRHNGVARVVVAPIAVPVPDGAVKRGAAVRDKAEHRMAPSDTSR